MNKIWIMLIAVILLVTACSNDIKYEEGKDTVKSYGDGTYQIIHQAINDNSVEVLTNCKYNQCVITDIKKYKEDGDFVYFVGNYYNNGVVCKLNTTDNMLSYFVEENNEELIMVYFDNMLGDNQIELYDSFDDFTSQDKKIFSDIKKLVF